MSIYVDANKNQLLVALPSQNRAQPDSFHITHEFLAYVLGMRRVGGCQYSATQWPD